MLTKTALAHFNESHVAVANALNLTRSAVYQWGEIVPKASALALEKISGGKIKVDERLYKSNRPRRDDERTTDAA